MLLTNRGCRRRFPAVGGPVVDDAFHHDRRGDSHDARQAGQLIAAAALFGRAGLGTALIAAFLVQVTPSVWTAYRSDRTTGIAVGTWLLIFGELLCWGVFGVYRSDPRLIVLGATGVAASLLVLARVAGPRPASTRARSAV